jgi:hypothetical protein
MDLIDSPKVYWIDEDAVQKVVRVVPGSFSRDSRNQRHSIQLEILLPKKYTVTQ